MNNFFKNDDFQLDEILFQGKNREYGAYALRHDANKILTKAMFVGIAFFATVAITPFVINSFKTKVQVIHPPQIPVDLENVDRPDKVIPPAETAPPQQQHQQEATINTTVPTPTKELTKPETPGVKTTDYNDAHAGTVNISGSVPTTTVPAVTVPTGGGTIISNPPIVKPKTNEPVIAPDKEAKFDGGIDAFRDKFQNKFDGSEFDGTGESLKTTLTFIVEKDGSISNVKANGKDVSFNSEALRAIKAVKGKWTPAQLDGESVRSYFTFPVSMKFE